MWGRSSFPSQGVAESRHRQELEHSPNALIFQVQAGVTSARSTGQGMGFPDQGRAVGEEDLRRRAVRFICCHFGESSRRLKDRDYADHKLEVPGFLCLWDFKAVKQNQAWGFRLERKTDI